MSDIRALRSYHAGPVPADPSGNNLQDGGRYHSGLTGDTPHLGTGSRAACRGLPAYRPGVRGFLERARVRRHGGGALHRPARLRPPVLREGGGQRVTWSPPPGTLSRFLIPTDPSGDSFSGLGGFQGTGRLNGSNAPQGVHSPIGRPALRRVVTLSSATRPVVWLRGPRCACP